MSGNSGRLMRFGAALFGCLGAAIADPAPAAGQAYVGVSAEEPSDTLARNVKILAREPRDFNALSAAGNAALALGDGQAAAGFFGRAEEVWPANAQPQIGKGAALAHEGDAAAALQYFARAVAMGATQSMVGLERGLAYDLLGNHAQAQADYRAALVGPGAEEARRRLALSLAIIGNKQEALSLLGPLMARGDAGAARCRAFVLALTGDPAGARSSIEAAMPGSASSMAYFFHKLPTLRSDQKAAAVHLGLFPDAAQLAATPAYTGGANGTARPAQTGNRLSSIDELLARQAAPPAVATPRQVASIPRLEVRSRPPQDPSPQGQVYESGRIWLQLASGTNPASFAGQFRKLASRHRNVFDGITGYVAEEPRSSRLLIGPFRSADEADIFARDLDTLRVDSFRWVNPPGQIIRKLSSE